MTDILSQAAKHQFHAVGDWLASKPDVNAADEKGWTVLHHAAAAEAAGKDVEDVVNMLLQAGADPHKPDQKGDTPFNIAAANSPASGRLMTNHWLDQALENKGAKRLNDRSGSHGSTLAQYMAKWLNDAEIEARLKLAVEAGMKPDVANASGWTPLTAAAAMGRAKAVEAFLWHYGLNEIYIPTAEEYATAYNGHKVVYPANITAPEVAFARLQQDKGASKELRDGLARSVALILTKN